MPGKAVRIPPDLLARFERFAERESKARNRAGLLPISGADLLRVVASRFVGLPASHDVDLAALRVREGLPADMTTPPHGGTTTKARRTAKKSSLTMETPPHGGRTAKKASP